jgi:hypothetical protein
MWHQFFDACSFFLFPHSEVAKYAAFLFLTFSYNERTRPDTCDTNFSIIGPLLLHRLRYRNITPQCHVDRSFLLCLRRPLLRDGNGYPLPEIRWVFALLGYGFESISLSMGLLMGSNGNPTSTWA